MCRGGSWLTSAYQRKHLFALGLSVSSCLPPGPSVLCSSPDPILVKWVLQLYESPADGMSDLDKSRRDQEKETSQWSALRKWHLQNKRLFIGSQSVDSVGFSFTLCVTIIPVPLLFILRLVLPLLTEVIVILLAILFQ